jgi:hypothetical protein
METSSVSSPYFLTFLAAQVKLGGKGFLSRDFTVQDLILNKSDVHHLFPCNLLKKQGLSRGGAGSVRHRRPEVRRHNRP